MTSNPTPYSVKSRNFANTHEGALKVNQLEEWRRELCDKIIPYEGDLNSYLNTFVPSRTPCTLPDPDVSVSAEWKPVKGQEAQNYGPLVDILNALVADFPAEKRPSFYQCSGQNLSFPFAAFAKHHHSARPDITVSFPGDVLPSHMVRPNWSRFSMVIEAKDTEQRDPFTGGGGIDGTNTLVQLAVNARGLMFAHGFLATFTLGVYGDVVRIARFDHACAVASPPFSLKAQDGLKAIRDFFWRFVHPWEAVGPRAVVGMDTTIRKLSPSDEEWLKEQLAEEAEDLLKDVDLHEGRIARVWRDNEYAKSKSYILFKLLDVNARLFSRSTMVWLGIEDTRESDGLDVGIGHTAATSDSTGVQLRIIKESWRQLVRIPEMLFYDRLKETIPNDEWVGLPELLDGGDLGARDVERWRAACAGEPWCGDDDLLDGMSVSSVSDASDTSDAPSSLFSSASASSSISEELQDDNHIPIKLEASPGSSENLVPYPLHQTWSWRLSTNEGCKVYERSHMRFVVDTVGRPLSCFKSTKELVMAIRDAIKGHRLAMEYGGILHKDVSSGNILIVDRPQPQHRSAGILHDFDYSSMTLLPPHEDSGGRFMGTGAPATLHPLELADEVEDVAKYKERTGTYYFIALELIDPAQVAALHEPHHDLESFYWVLIYILLRHTAHNHADPKPCDVVFPFGNDYQAATGKRGFLHESSLIITGNAPLTDMLEALNELVVEANRRRRPGRSRKPLTYDEVLAIFDEALLRNDWPENDKAIPYVHGKIRTNTVFRGRIPSRANKSTKRAIAEEEASGSDIESGSMTLGSNASAMAKRSKRAHRAPAQTPRSEGAAATSSSRVARHASGGRPKSESKRTASGRSKASGRKKTSRS
ncbi:hypothetical protein OH77DRAFT_1413071 [Trametes cingulata]|nr:hypothetical protein OH77DRAFT_1413071 [Trametes cingulata]